MFYHQQCRFLRQRQPALVFYQRFGFLRHPKLAWMFLLTRATEPA